MTQAPLAQAGGAAAPLVCTSTNNADEEIRRLFRGSNRTLAASLIEIADSLREYWPLTVRQLFYQAVAQAILSNCLKEYRRVSAVLTELRREDLLPWHAIADRTRRTVDKRGEPDVSEYLRRQFSGVFTPYGFGRCYIQNQPVYVEVSVEKDALASIATSAIYPYCTRLNVTRGHPSASMQNSMAERFDRAIQRGKQPILLHFGDLDPSGVAIPKALQSKLYEHHGLDVDVRRVALTPEQVSAFSLPESLDAAKRQDPNYPAWLREFGSAMKPVELDALHPAMFERLITETLESIYDMSEFHAQKEQEKRDRAEIQKIQHSVQDYLARTFPQYFRDETLAA